MSGCTTLNMSPAETEATLRDEPITAGVTDKPITVEVPNLAPIEVEICE